MSSPFNFDAPLGHGDSLYDDIQNAIAFQGGGFAIYQTNDGLPQGGVNINQDFSNRAISPNIDLGELGNRLVNTTPLYVWLLIILGILAIILKEK